MFCNALRFQVKQSKTANKCRDNILMGVKVFIVKKLL